MFKQYRWCEIIKYNSKQIQVSFQELWVKSWAKLWKVMGKVLGKSWLSLQFIFVFLIYRF